jgi:hypothetical protein
LSEEFDIRRVRPVADGEHAAGVGAVGRKSQRRLAGEADIGQIRAGEELLISSNPQEIIHRWRPDARARSLCRAELNAVAQKSISRYVDECIIRPVDVVAITGR